MPYRCAQCGKDFPTRKGLVGHLTATRPCYTRAAEILTAPQLPKCARCRGNLGPAYHLSRSGFVCCSCLTPEEIAAAQRDVEEILGKPQPVATALACAGLLAAGAIGAAILLGLKAMEVLGA